MRGCPIQEELVEKLSQFGFTVNQAKVYLSIIQAGTISAGKISKLTQVHRQDIYKILPKLERKGLITKTIDKPFKIQAIPLETALQQLVLKEREKSNRKIAALEGNLKNLVNSLKGQPKKEEEAWFTLLTTNDSIRNKANLSFEGPKKDVKVAISLELLLLLIRINEFASLLSKRKTRTCLLTSATENNGTIQKTLESLSPDPGFFKTKYCANKILKQYLILDRKEVWIATEQKTESDFPCILWTNDKNIVQVYEENFRVNWSQAADMVYPKTAAKKEEKGKLILA